MQRGNPILETRRAPIRIGISEGYSEILSEKKPTEQRHMSKTAENATAAILSFFIDICANQESLFPVPEIKLHLQPPFRFRPVFGVSELL